MIYLLGKLIIYAIIFFVIAAFVVVVYCVILSFHEDIMNENPNDHAQISNTDDNGMRVDLVESEVPLAELQADLNAGKWLLVNSLLINPTRIDSIVEVKNEEEDHGE